MVFASSFTVCHFGSLNDMMSVDVRVALNRLQGKAMMLPCGEVVGTVYRHTPSFHLPLDFVLAEPEEFPSILIDRNTASMSIHQFSLSVSPSCSRDDPFGGNGCSS